VPNNATVGLICAQGRSVVLQVISDGNAKHCRCSFRRAGNQVQFGLNEIDLVESNDSDCCRKNPKTRKEAKNLRSIKHSPVVWH
jgi:hypothetical protein